MTKAKTPQPPAASPFQALGAGTSPGPQAPQIITLAMLSAAKDSCVCDTCRLMRKLVDSMKEEILGSTA